jgi:hypothetical protein
MQSRAQQQNAQLFRRRLHLYIHHPSVTYFTAHAAAAALEFTVTSKQFWFLFLARLMITMQYGLSRKFCVLSQFQVQCQESLFPWIAK